MTFNRRQDRRPEYVLVDNSTIEKNGKRIPLNFLDSGQLYDMRIGEYGSASVSFRRGLTIEELKKIYDPSTKIFVSPSINRTGVNKKVSYNGKRLSLAEVNEQLSMGFYFIRKKSHKAHSVPRISGKKLVDSIKERNWNLNEVIIENGNLPYLKLYDKILEEK